MRLVCCKYAFRILYVDVLTRAGPGVAFEHPLRFFADISKTAARSAAVFGTPIHTSFRTCENVIPRSLKVRSPGHGKCPHLRKSLNARHSYTE